jgi:hypothetical protein
MSLSNLISEVSQVTGVVDLSRVSAAVRTAAKELWAAGEFPGELQQTRIQVVSDDTNANNYATTPYDVQEIRRIKSPTGKLNVEYSNASRDYDGWLDIQDIFEVRLVRITPLARRITNATRLTARMLKAATAPLTITFGGITNQATHVEEPLVFEIGATTVTSTECFTDLRLLQKSAVAPADILITDADGVELCRFANTVLSNRLKLFEFRPPEMAFTDQFMGLYDILYKPILPEITETVGYFPPELDIALIWLAISHLYMSQEDKIAQGVHYRNLCAEVLQELQANEAVGKAIKRPQTYNKFITTVRSRI